MATGGTLEPDLLLRAYRSGIFPWSSDPVITWWCPDPRAIMDLGTFHAPRSLRKRIRRSAWRFSVDQAFTSVIRRCAEPAPGRPSTWITQDFIDSYTELHRRGVVHSVEVWEGTDVVGGLYGVAIGGFFGGESMFHRRSDASKAAVVHLVDHVRGRGFVLLDAQVPTPRLARLGAVEIPRADYLGRLRAAIALEVKF